MASSRALGLAVTSATGAAGLQFPQEAPGASAPTPVDVRIISATHQDLAQCVVGDRIVMWDRMRDKWTNEAGVHEKFGVGPASIPDLLALMGDTATSGSSTIMPTPASRPSRPSPRKRA